jgi:flagellar hook-basal body complex protein FliE
MSMFLGHKPNKQHLQALRRCKEDQQFVELLNQKLDELYKSITTADEQVTIYRTQGKISVLKDLLDAAEKSREVLERL